MVTQEDTVFVQGMDPTTTEEDMCKYFGAIGVIKVNIALTSFISSYIVSKYYIYLLSIQ